MTRPEWEPASAPADDRPTLLSHALALSALHGPGPWPDEGHPLPDEPPRPDDGTVFLPSVVLDGVRTHHFGTEPALASAIEIADLLERLLAAPTGQADMEGLHERLAGETAVNIADDLVRELRQRRLPRRRLRAVARWLAEHGTRRDTVKLGIVMLGVAGDERDRELLLLLGALEELTLYAVVALARTQPDPRRAAYDLARRVSGWGRIHAVERLKGCDDPEIKAWLLRDGFRNGVMYEYLAHIAATTGDLYSALLDAGPGDAALLDGAGAILTALAGGGPAEDMSDYPEAVPAMHRFAELAAEAEPTLTRLDHLLSIARVPEWTDEEMSWPDGEPDRLAARYAALLDRPVWRDVVRAELTRAADEYRFNVALSCAPRLGVTALPHAMARLEHDPFNGYVWQWVLGHAGAGEIAEVTALAERLLPLGRIGTGPERNVGFGAGHLPDHAIETVISGLGRHPGTGLTLLRAALAGRIIQLRRAAVRSLSSWPDGSVPGEAVAWIDAAARDEPDASLRDELAVLLIRAAS